VRAAVDSLPEYVDGFIKNAQVTSSLVQAQERNGKIRLPRVVLNVLLWRFCDSLSVKGYRLIKSARDPVSSYRCSRAMPRFALIIGPSGSPG